jgi:hypothetical protein
LVVAAIGVAVADSATVGVGGVWLPFYSSSTGRRVLGGAAKIWRWSVVSGGGHVLDLVWI